MRNSGMVDDPRNRREVRLVVASLAASVAIHAAAFGFAPRLRTESGAPPLPLSVFLPTAQAPTAPSEETSPPRSPQPPTPVAPRERRSVPSKSGGVAETQHRKVLAAVPAARTAYRQPEADDAAARPLPHRAAPREISAPTTRTAVAVSTVPARNLAAESFTPPAFRAEYLRNPPPIYPLRARRDGVEGTVMLRVLVTAAGAPGKVEVDVSSGSEALDRAAQDAVRSWRFVPARRGDAAVDAWVVVPLVFRLESG